MMIYLKVKKDFLDTSQFVSEIKYFYIEIDKNGFVIREVGLNHQKQIVHRYPDKNFKYGRYGIFDLAMFDISSIKNSDLTKQYFDELWNLGDNDNASNPNI